MFDEKFRGGPFLDIVSYSQHAAEIEIPKWLAWKSGPEIEFMDKIRDKKSGTTVPLITLKTMWEDS